MVNVPYMTYFIVLMQIESLKWNMEIPKEVSSNRQTTWAGEGGFLYGVNLDDVIPFVLESEAKHFKTANIKSLQAFCIDA